MFRNKQCNMCNYRIIHWFLRVVLYIHSHRRYCAILRHRPIHDLHKVRTKIRLIPITRKRFTPSFKFVAEILQRFHFIVVKIYLIHRYWVRPMPINAIKISVDSKVWLSICEIMTIASCSYRVLRLDNRFHRFVW